MFSSDQLELLTKLFRSDRTTENKKDQICSKDRAWQEKKRQNMPVKKGGMALTDQDSAGQEMGGDTTKQTQDRKGKDRTRP